MLPPEAIDAMRREATHQFIFALDSVRPVDVTSGALHRCRAEGRVLTVLRSPRDADASVLGGPFSIDVPCWPTGRERDEPPGPARIPYGSGAAPTRLEVWGRIIDGTFVVVDFRELPTGPSPDA